MRGKHTPTFTCTVHTFLLRAEFYYFMLFLYFCCNFPEHGKNRGLTDLISADLVKTTCHISLQHVIQPGTDVNANQSVSSFFAYQQPLFFFVWSFLCWCCSALCCSLTDPTGDFSWAEKSMQKLHGGKKKFEYKNVFIFVMVKLFEIY